MKFLKTVISAIVLCTGFIGFAQYTDVINSNRPGMSRSAFSVGTNVLQFELGGNYIQEKHNLFNNEVTGFGADFAIRYGLFFEQLELNIEGNYQNDTFTDMRSVITSETKRSNFKYAAIGAKYLIYDPYKNAEEEKPNLYSWKANRRFRWKSLIPAVSLYVGANYDAKDNVYLTPGVEGFSPRAMFATQHNFSGGWVFVMNFMKDRIGTEQSDFTYILTLTHALSEKWVVFGETQGIKSDIYADNLIRLGGAYLWQKNFQLDTALTFNAKDTPAVFNLTLGASYRLDFHKDKKIDNNNSASDVLNRKLNGKGKKKKRNKANDNTSTPVKQKRERQDFDN